MPFPDLPNALARALAARSFDEPTPVQDAVLAPAHAGRDLLVSARTGSGKTVAFGLAMAPDLLDGGERFPFARAPLALVIAPTRELAQQVAVELSWLFADAGGRVAIAVGGMDPRREARAFASGTHLVVGTPGRLRDHIERGQLDLAAIRAVVLDEADEMLDLGFREELEAILGSVPVARRTLLFSATLPAPIVSLARRFQNEAVRIDAGGGRTEPHADITHEAVLVAPGETVPAVVNVLRERDAPLAIVFCATRDNVRALWTALVNRGFDAVALSGELSQNDRNQALHALRSGRARVCVATDVAARGLDLPALTLVVQAELPGSAELLLHRSGRTGRAGRKGAAVTLVLPSRRRRAEALFREARVHEVRWAVVPTADAIRRRDHERLLADRALLDPPDDDEADAADALLDGRDPRAVAVALLRFHRASLPEEAPVTPAVAPASTPAAPGVGAVGRRSGPGRDAAAGIVWLSAAVGREARADPKWLLPVLCRMGGVTRREIGLIRVLAGETRFEVAGAVADAFLARASADGSGGPRITRAEAPTREGGRPQAPHRAARRADGPQGQRSSRRRTG